ncbi:THAP domain-containing protein 1-like [Episyrphus balteatus]|uniref:THAP domain-containing protein 1-like n=1 Tax=Episyrphus balteatus TaxID=286459 RepID=UPI002484E7A0|nr:THAP domain-containing protein 1-like [Episyrphus balteatus]
MGGCSVFGCNNSTRTKQTNTSFHKFPKRNSKISKQWIVFCKRKDLINIQSARICSLHFVKDDFINNIKFDMGFTAYRMLKPDAVPTIYLKGNFEFESTECSKEITAEQTEQNNLEISVSKQFDSEILIENEENECLSNANASDPLSLEKTNQLYEEIKLLRAENEILNSKLSKAEKTITSLRTRIKELEIHPNN